MNDELKKLNVSELNEKLEELKKEKVKLESDMFRHNGSSVLTRNYPTVIQKLPYGNLKKIKKMIARIHTYISIKSI